MIFDIQTMNKKIVDAYSIAQEIMLSEEFDSRLSDVRKYTYTTVEPKKIYSSFSIFREAIKTGKAEKIRVKAYIYPSKSVVATTGLKDDPEAIFINMNNINYFPFSQYVGNASHEWSHKPFGFGHGSNYTQQTRWGRMMCRLSGDKEDKDFSVPYTFERIVLEIAKSKKLL